MKKINLLLVSLSFLGSILLYNKLPQDIPMHWNVRGQIDNYMDKSVAVWMMPMMVLGMSILFRIFSMIDPKKQRYELFKREWEIMQTVYIAFFVYLHFVIFYMSLNPTKDLLPLMFLGMGILFTLLGNYMGKIRQNYFIGIKLPWTLSNEDNWNKTHRFASWTITISGLVVLLEAVVLWKAPIIVFGSIALGFILPTIYSFLLYNKTSKVH